MARYSPRGLEVRRPPPPATSPVRQPRAVRHPTSPIADQARETAAFEVDIGEILRSIWRRRWIVVGVAMLGTSLGVGAAFAWTPSYTSETRIKLDSRRNEILDNPAVLSGMTITDELVETEIEVVASRNIKQQAAAAADLPALLETRRQAADAPSFAAPIFAGVNERLEQWRPTLEAWLPASILEPVMAPEEPVEPIDLDDAVGFLGKALDARQVGNTSVMQIRVSDEDPELAAGLANAVANAYLDDQLAWKRSETTSANDFLDSRIADLREELRAKREQLQAVRSSTGAVGEAGSSLLAQRRLLSNERLLDARNERIRLETDLETIENALGSSSPEDVAAIVDTPLMTTLRSDAVARSQELAELSSVYGERHPAFLDAQGRLAEIRGEIAAEAQRYASRVQTELTAARREEASFQTELEQQNAEDRTFDQQRGLAESLRREIDATQSLLDDYLTRFKETEEQQAVLRPDARVITEATPPAFADPPSRSMIVAASTALAGMLGIVLAFVRDTTDSSLRSTADAEAALAVPVLAAIPVIKDKRARRAPVAYVAKRPASALSEAVRNVFTSLGLRAEPDRAQFLLVSSAVAGEGKSTIVGVMAQQLARARVRAAVVECDLRRPTLAASLHCVRMPGLIDYLEGSETYRDVIQPSERYGMDVIVAGGTSENSLYLLQSRAMQELLDRLSTDYDVVILDSPPAVALPDAQVLAEHADAVLFLCHWGRTARNTSAAGVRALDRPQGPPVFAALTQVDMDSFPSYDRAYSDPSLGNYYVN